MGSLGRTAAKALFFASKGVRFSTAGWLATRDAPIANSYTGVDPHSLESYWNVAGSWQDLAASDGVAASKALGLTFGDNPLVSAGYKAFVLLSQRGWRFSEIDDRSILAETDNLKLNICTVEECNMLKEIFVDECYSLKLPGTWSVLDVGGNVGMAALYFAGLPWVESVVSFEPFKPTATAFIKNLEMNRGLRGKITLVNKGVGEKSCNIEAAYSSELRGSMSLGGVGSWCGLHKPSDSLELVELVAAESAAKAACRSEKSWRLLAKIDCEGSEYGILRRLKETNTLRLFSAFLIEWHGEGPQELTGILKREGFAVREQAFAADTKVLGLISAVRLPED